MEVFKRSRSSSWYVDMTHPVTGVRLRQSLSFHGSKVEAQKKARQLEAALEHDKLEQQEHGKRPITVGQAVEAYLSVLEAKGQVAAKDHRYRAARLWSMIPQDKELHTLTPQDAENLVLARTKAGKKPQTIKHDLSLLRSATRYVGGLGYRVPPNMNWRVPKVVQKTRYLSPEEFETLYAYLDPDRPVGGRRLPDHLMVRRAEVRDLVVALGYTGGRWSEIAHLSWDRVDLRTGSIRLWAGKVNRERVVPIAERLGATLRRRLAERAAGASLVFPGPGGKPRAQPSRAIGEAMDEVGLNASDTVAKYGRATVHSLRHTFASWLIQNGADLGEVADALGHASLNMTRRYAHLSKGATLAKLGGILNGIEAGTGGPGQGPAESTGGRGNSARAAPEEADRGG